MIGDMEKHGFSLGPDSCWFYRWRRDYRTNSIRSLLSIVVLFLPCSGTFASDYSVNVLPHQLSDAQEVVEVDIAGLKPGDVLEVDYRGSPVWIYRRTQEQLDLISKHYTGLTDEAIESIVNRIKRGAGSTLGYLGARLQLVDHPELEKSPYRSKIPEYFVFQPTGYVGCKLEIQHTSSNTETDNEAWLFDPCGSQTYDLTGQFLSQIGSLYSMDTGEPIVFDSKTYPRTKIPPHSYSVEGTLTIGVSDISAAPDIPLTEEALFADLSPTEVLLVATAFNDIERARTAIKEGADVMSSGDFIPDPKVSLALRRAALFSSAEMVKLLLSHGATPTEVEIDDAKIGKRHDISKLLEAATDQ